MESLEKIIEFIKDFVVDGGRRYLEKKIFDFLWEKIKPILLKVGKKLWKLVKGKLRKIKKKWLDFKKRKRASTAIPALIFMNEHRKDNHSYVNLIMIIAGPTCIITIIVISHK